MRVQFVNNAGGGIADWVDMPADSSVQDLLTKYHCDSTPENATIRKNNTLVNDASEKLFDNDSVVVVPRNFKGA